MAKQPSHSGGSSHSKKTESSTSEQKSHSSSHEQKSHSPSGSHESSRSDSSNNSTHNEPGGGRTEHGTHHESQHLSQMTTDHETIRKWAEQRGAHPACVKRTGSKDDPGIIRLDFPGYTGSESLQQISWDEFFEKFDESELALVYQEKTSTGERSNFNKLVRRTEESSRKH